jgi:hypothetical protein
VADWLWHVWAQLWPNLAASVIWSIPAGAAFLWHHRRVRNSLASLHRKLDEQQHPAGRHTRG